MKSRKLANLNYVSDLERKLDKIETILEIVESWSKDQENGLTDSSICISAIKDIRRVVKE